MIESKVNIYQSIYNPNIYFYQIEIDSQIILDLVYCYDKDPIRWLWSTIVDKILKNVDDCDKITLETNPPESKFKEIDDNLFYGLVDSFQTNFKNLRKLIAEVDRVRHLNPSLISKLI